MNLQRSLQAFRSASFREAREVRENIEFSTDGRESLHSRSARIMDTFDNYIAPGGAYPRREVFNESLRTTHHLARQYPYPGGYAAHRGVPHVAFRPPAFMPPPAYASVSPSAPGILPPGMDSPMTVSPMLSSPDPAEAADARHEARIKKAAAEVEGDAEIFLARVYGSEPSVQEQHRKQIRAYLSRNDDTGLGLARRYLEASRKYAATLDPLRVVPEPAPAVRPPEYTDEDLRERAAKNATELKEYLEKTLPAPPGGGARTVEINGGFTVVVKNAGAIEGRFYVRPHARLEVHDRTVISADGDSRDMILNFGYDVRSINEYGQRIQWLFEARDALENRRLRAESAAKALRSTYAVLPGVSFDAHIEDGRAVLRGRVPEFRSFGESSHSVPVEAASTEGSLVAAFEKHMRLPERKIEREARQTLLQSVCKEVTGAYDLAGGTIREENDTIVFMPSGIDARPTMLYIGNNIAYRGQYNVENYRTDYSTPVPRSGLSAAVAGKLGLRSYAAIAKESEAAEFAVKEANVGLQAVEKILRGGTYDLRGVVITTDLPNRTLRIRNTRTSPIRNRSYRFFPFTERPGQFLVSIPEGTSVRTAADTPVRLLGPIAETADIPLATEALHKRRAEFEKVLSGYSSINSSLRTRLVNEFREMPDARQIAALSAIGAILPADRAVFVEMLNRERRVFDQPAHALRCIPRMSSDQFARACAGDVVTIVLTPPMTEGQKKALFAIINASIPDRSTFNLFNNNKEAIHSFFSAYFPAA